MLAPSLEILTSSAVETKCKVSLLNKLESKVEAPGQTMLAASVCCRKNDTDRAPPASPITQWARSNDSGSITLRNKDASEFKLRKARP